MPLPAAEPDCLNLWLFGPGFGELVLVCAPPGRWLVVDGCNGGDDLGYAQRALDALGAKPSLVLLSHPHKDHADGLREVIERATQAGDLPRSSVPVVGVGKQLRPFEILTRDPQEVGDDDLSAPIKPLLEAIEHLAAFATAYRYPSPVGRIKATPPASDVTTYIADVERALNEAVRRFGVDLTKANAPASTSGPIR